MVKDNALFVFNLFFFLYLEFLLSSILIMTVIKISKLLFVIDRFSVEVVWIELSFFEIMRKGFCVLTDFVPKEI